MEHPTPKAKFALSRGAIVAIAVVVLVGVASFGTFAYGMYFKQWDSPLIRTTADLFGVSAARVGQDKVPYTLYLVHVDAAREIIKQPYAKQLGAPDTLTSQLKSDALDFAIRTVAVERFAKDRNIIVTPVDVDRAFESIRQQAGTSTSPEEINTILHTQFGMDEPTFKEYIVRPAVLEDLLKQKGLDDTKQADAFTKELDARLAKPDVVKYLKF